ncbi:MAG: hypothetical protein ACIALR_04155 [Blastopirellula sp. JB062]
MLSAGTGAGGIGAAESSAGIGDIGALMSPPQVLHPPQAVSQPQPLSQQLLLHLGKQNRRLMASRIGVHEQHFGAQAVSQPQVGSGAQQVASTSQPQPVSQPPQLEPQRFLCENKPLSKPPRLLQHEVEQPHDASGAQQVGSGAQQVASTSQPQAVSQPPQQLFLCENKLLRASRNGVQHFLAHGSQQVGSGAQQVGSGAQQVAGAGAQQVGFGAQQRGAGVQHLGVWQHEVEQPQPPPSI